MGAWRLRRLVFGSSGAFIPLAANALNSVSHSRFRLLVVVAALLVIVAIPILCAPDVSSAAGDGTLTCYDSAGNSIFCRSRMPMLTANSTLKCYDSAGRYESCATLASTPLSENNDPTIGNDQPATVTTTASYREPNPTFAPANQSTNWAASAPTALPASAPEKRRAAAACGRRLIPCFFSALRRGVTHVALVASRHGARPARTFNANNF
jgi:hypothetical protein